ncbi:MAG: succinate dehydrogenase assembly factor 2 [Pseudomonadota bacterium]
MNDTENDKRLKRLKYRANHRGIKEMDIILGGFANARLDALSAEELDDFENLMQENDRDLLMWFTGEAEFPHEALQNIFRIVSDHLAPHSQNA